MLVDDRLEKVPEHLLGDVEVGDHAVLHRPHGDHVVGGAAQHPLRVQTDALDLVGAALQRDYGRLIEHDPLTFDVDEGVRRSEIHGNRIRGKERFPDLPEGPAHQFVIRPFHTERAGNRGEETTAGLVKVKNLVSA